MPSPWTTWTNHKLSFEQRQEANDLVQQIIDDPDAAAHEIVSLRGQLADTVARNKLKRETILDLIRHPCVIDECQHQQPVECLYALQQSIKDMGQVTDTGG